jgi:branched-chain amino acid transport system substrate-binding protein
MIGYSDTWGDQWVEQLRNHGANHGVEVIADERYGRSDTSVTGQVLKLISLNPDAILVAASYAGAALPQLELVERGYKGLIYQTQGIDRKSFMTAAGSSAEGILFTADPQAVAKVLTEDSPTREESLRFVNVFEAAYGPDSYSSSASFAWDAIEVLRHVLAAALAEGEPGTPEFRAGLKKALEQASGIVGSNGVYNFSADDHWGLSNDDSVVIATVKDGQWQLAD